MIRSILIYLVIAMSISGCATKQGTESPFRNIVVIIGDDHAASVLGAYGNAHIQTPHLDRLARTGVRFTHAYANSPMCSASRQSMLTGRYPHAAGVSLLRTSFPDSQYTVAEHLSAQGFATALFGKHHFNNNGHHGFEHFVSQAEYRHYLSTIDPAPLPDSIPVRPPWKPFQDHARIWLNAEARPDQYADQHSRGTFYAREAVQWLSKNGDKPFFAWIAFNEPHSPFNFPHNFWKQYTPDAFELPPTSPEDERWIPEVFRDLTNDEKKGILSAYYASVSYLDKNVGMILEALEQQNLLDETLIVYVSDHGYLLADHGRFEKHMMWEEAVQVPLIVRGRQSWGTGSQRDQLVELVDLVPSLLEAVQVQKMDGLQGNSLIPLLENPQANHKEFVFSEFLADEKLMVRQKEWKYIFTPGRRDLQQGYATGYGPSGVSHRLYDLRNDPEEKQNLAAVPAQEERLLMLQDQMLDWLSSTHPLGDRISGSRIERLSRYAIPPEGFQAGAK